MNSGFWSATSTAKSACSRSRPAMSSSGRSKYNLWGAPVWRNSEEITYARRNPLIDGKVPARKAEIILRKAVPGQGDKEKVLSRNWPDAMLESVYTGSEKN